MFLFGIFATPVPYVIFFFIYLWSCAFVFNNELPPDEHLTQELVIVTLTVAADDSECNSTTIAKDALFYSGFNVHIQTAPPLRTCTANAVDARMQELTCSALSRPPPSPVC